MIRRILGWGGVIAALAIVIALASAPQYWKRYVASFIYMETDAPLWFYEPRVKVSGKPGSGPPHVSPELQAIDPAALQAAADLAAQTGAQALIVSRRSHIVLEKYWDGAAPGILANSGTFIQPVTAILLSIARSESKIGSFDEPVANYLKERHDSTPLRELDARTLALVIERATGEPYAQYLSTRLWKRIGASDAYLWNDHIDCCMLAHPVDWMRLADVLANDGVYLGDEILRPGQVTQLLVPAKGSPHSSLRLATSAETFAAPDIFVLDGGRQRLWVSPSLRLSILQIGGTRSAEPWSDARIPNLIMNGLQDFQPAAAPARAVNPADYAPGH